MARADDWDRCYYINPWLFDGEHRAMRPSPPLVEVSPTSRETSGSVSPAIRPFVRCFHAGCEWLAHSLLAIFVIACMAAVEWMLHYLLASATFFGVLPISWIFNGADLAVLIGLSYYGVRASIAAYRESDEV